MTVITGTIKTIDYPDDAALTTVKDLLNDLERYLAVEIPVEKITNVFVSIDEPEVTERDIIWYRVDSSGNFKGQYVYIQNKWIQMFPPPNGIFRMYGDSRAIPPGYALIDNTLDGFTAAMVAGIRGNANANWVADPTGTYFLVFDVVYVGL